MRLLYYIIIYTSSLSPLSFFLSPSFIVKKFIRKQSTDATFISRPRDTKMNRIGARNCILIYNLSVFNIFHIAFRSRVCLVSEKSRDVLITHHYGDAITRFTRKTLAETRLAHFRTARFTSSTDTGMRVYQLARVSEEGPRRLSPRPKPPYSPPPGALSHGFRFTRLSLLRSAARSPINAFRGVSKELPGVALKMD